MKSDWDRFYASGDGGAPETSGGDGTPEATPQGPAGGDVPEAAPGGPSAGAPALPAASRLTDLVAGAGDGPKVPVAAAFGTLPTAQEGAHAALLAELTDLHAGNGDPVA